MGLIINYNSKKIIQYNLVMPKINFGLLAEAILKNIGQKHMMLIVMYKEFKYRLLVIFKGTNKSCVIDLFYFCFISSWFFYEKV